MKVIMENDEEIERPASYYINKTCKFCSRDLYMVFTKHPTRHVLRENGWSHVGSQRRECDTVATPKED